jgi:glycopeptide antibiotics resistance protein
MPATFRPLRRIILGMPENNQWFSRPNMMDVTINILGFVPFGFFLIAWLVKVRNIPFPRAFGISILLGFSISLMIELTQAYLPMRDSSLLDLINNTLGTVVGALLLKIRAFNLS